MRVVLSTIGKFHTFDLARQLHRRDMLTAIFTGYPRFKLRDEGLPASLIRSFPWFQTLYMGRGRLGLNGAGFERALAWCDHQTHDLYTAACLPPCDVFMGLSGSGLRAGLLSQRRGGGYVCDRPASHIRYRDRLLREEYARHGLPFDGEDPRDMAFEEREYAAADLITVPSEFVRRSFLEMGVPDGKVHRVPYGVDLSRFQPVAEPDEGTFDVLFVGQASFRKGIPYLLEAFGRLAHPRKRLTIVGTVPADTAGLIAAAAARLPVVRTGHVPQPRLKEIMSRSHVMVLPSVEEGLAYVQAQAMACACPVIGTPNSGAEDLFSDGIEGFIVPIRDAHTLAERLQSLADDPDRRRRMARAALARVQSLGGWDRYGEAIVALLEGRPAPTQAGTEGVRA